MRVLATRDDLDHLGVDGLGVGLEGGVLQDEGPHVVAEAEGVEVALDVDLGLDLVGEHPENDCATSERASERGEEESKRRTPHEMDRESVTSTLSNCCSTFKASAGGIEPFCTSSSSASVSVTPMVLLR